MSEAPGAVYKFRKGKWLGVFKSRLKFFVFLRPETSPRTLKDFLR